MNGDIAVPGGLTRARRRAGAGARRGAPGRAARPLRHERVRAGQTRPPTKRWRAATCPGRRRRAERSALRAVRREPLEEYRAWARREPVDGDAPARGGESRYAIVERYARAFRELLARPGGDDPRRRPLAPDLLRARRPRRAPSRRARSARRERDAVPVHAPRARDGRRRARDAGSPRRWWTGEAHCPDGRSRAYRGPHPPQPS